MANKKMHLHRTGIVEPNMKYKLLFTAFVLATVLFSAGISAETQTESCESVCRTYSDCVLAQFEGPVSEEQKTNLTEGCLAGCKENADAALACLAEYKDQCSELGTCLIQGFTE